MKEKRLKTSSKNDYEKEAGGTPFPIRRAECQNGVISR